MGVIATTASAQDAVELHRFKAGEIEIQATELELGATAIIDEAE